MIRVVPVRLEPLKAATAARRPFGAPAQARFWGVGVVARIESLDYWDGEPPG